MWNWVLTLDRILRGEATRLQTLREGELDVPVLGLVAMIDILGILYGACMGLFSLTPGGSGHRLQIVATMFKVPSLFLLTLLVTFPSLYVFNALVGSKLFLVSLLRLLIASLAVMLAVLSSFGPIVGFFSFTTTSYPFMILLNVVVFGIAGLLGLVFLLQTLHRLTISIAQAPPPPATDETSIPAPVVAGPLDHAGETLLAPHVKTVFRIWVIVFGLVGSQMAWVLRPFIGRPDQAFAWFRHPESNFFQAVMNAAMKMIW
jgi:hypothetical protein